jgi:hypothetical protein
MSQRFKAKSAGNPTILKDFRRFSLLRRETINCGKLTFLGTFEVIIFHRFPIS